MEKELKENLGVVCNWDNYKPLLLKALESTKGNIIELGCGDGSTKFLQWYSKKHNRKLFSYDYNKDWAEKFGAVHVKSWSEVEFPHEVSVILVDESPGEQRKYSIMNFKDRAEIIIVHDSEPKGWNASDYRVRPCFQHFKYVIEVKPRKEDGNGAWATMLSNTIDIEKFIGFEVDGYKIIPNQHVI